MKQRIIRFKPFTSSVIRRALAVPLLLVMLGAEEQCENPQPIEPPGDPGPGFPDGGHSPGEPGSGTGPAPTPEPPPPPDPLPPDDIPNTESGRVIP